MTLMLKKSTQSEAPILLEIQQQAFEADLRMYEDITSSPVNEPLDRLQYKIQHYEHFTIWHNTEIIGGIDIRKLPNNHYRLNRIFIADAYQNNGLGTQIMQLIENAFPDARSWTLDTPHLNTRNHHFYEKLGYAKIGEHKISDKLTLFDYEKIMPIFKES